jgi:hypothetical protein
MINVIILFHCPVEIFERHQLDFAVVGLQRKDRQGLFKIVRPSYEAQHISKMEIFQNRKPK